MTIDWFEASQEAFRNQQTRQSARHLQLVSKHGEPWRKGRPRHDGLAFKELHVGMRIRVCDVGWGHSLGVVAEICDNYILVTLDRNPTSNLLLFDTWCGLRPTEDGTYHHWCWLEPVT